MNLSPIGYTHIMYHVLLHIDFHQRNIQFFYNIKRHRLALDVSTAEDEDAFQSTSPQNLIDPDLIKNRNLKKIH